ncbi:MFS transporter [Candidatus Solirubrobacter pratensis]|uniref:MFS transporter n=1 Tax=Candidatus Solirubrobacter pratensis TaxID=1298857 RepID=UPI000423ADB2|nr:MFS transporter [Candidatus Solirubrobacter pratensis]
MVLALLCSAQFVAVLDTTIVAVALPAIQRDLGFGPASLQWVVTAYTLAFGGLLIAGGRAGDVFGRRRLFVAGLAVFTAASAGCGLAPSPAALVALRAIQGAGCALMTPAALALVTATRAPHALGAWTAAAAGGGASGWVLGGILTEHVGWEAIFFVNVPLGAAGVLLAGRLLRGGGERRPAAAARGSLDLPGAATVTAALVALVLAFTQAGSRGFGSPVVLGTLAAAVILLAAFAAVERRARDPLLPLAVLGNRPFVRANLVAAALTAATTPAMLMSILYQQQVLGRSATQTGLACMPFNVAVIAGSLLGGRVGGMRTGLLGVAAGSLLFSTGALIPASVIMGFGLGVASVGSTAAGTAALPERPGLASGLLNSAAQVGTVLGVAVIVSLAAALGQGAGEPVITGYRWGFGAAALIALAGIVAQLQRRRPKRCESAYAP